MKVRTTKCGNSDLLIINPQHVSRVFTPIVRRSGCILLPIVSCYSCYDAGESGSEMCALWRGCCLTVGVNTAETCWGIDWLLINLTCCIQLVSPPFTYRRRPVGRSAEHKLFIQFRFIQLLFCDDEYQLSVKALFWCWNGLLFVLLVLLDDGFM
jgi:hypothetical protein